MTRATATDATQTAPDPLGATLAEGMSPSQRKRTLQTLLETLEGFDPATEAENCLAAAKRFATMKRIVFETRIAGLMTEAASAGEKQALEEIGRRGPRRYARLLLELARDLGEGGALRVAREQMIHDLKIRLL